MISPFRIYALSVALGFLIAYFIGRKTKKFLWHEYLIMFIGPAFGLYYLTAAYGIKPILIFIIGAPSLTILEWLTGLVYHKVMGSHLWLYERSSLPGKYASFLGLPFWGLGAVLFWFILRGL